MSAVKPARRAKVGNVPGVRQFEEVLPGALFERLGAAVRSIGRRRLKRTYTTTFWLPLGEAPRNVAEACALQLLPVADPGSACAGIEWWLGRLEHGEKLRFHFDRDMTLRKRNGQFDHPLLASILYINHFPTSPTVILEQIPSPDGRTRIPEKPRLKQIIEAVPNRYTVFPGNLRHGVIPNEIAARSPGVDGLAQELRLSLLVNYWDHRPLPPLARDYDGTVYPDLRD